MENSLNIKVSTASLLKYALPTILSNLFMNIYSIVDQLFVSNLLGTDALSAVSIVWPLLILPGLLGVDGVWLSMPAAEVLSILLSVYYFRHFKGKYHYA